MRYVGLPSAMSAFVLLAVSALDAQSNLLPFGAMQRASDTPIISPTGDGWESAGTFNPAVIQVKKKFVMLYRAQDHAGTSRLGYAESSDSIHFERQPDPVFLPAMDYEKAGGVEDPRLVKIGDT